jgi:hypothetical protein
VNVERLRSRANGFRKGSTGINIVTNVGYGRHYLQRGRQIAAHPSTSGLEKSTKLTRELACQDAGGHGFRSTDERDYTGDDHGLYLPTLPGLTLTQIIILLVLTVQGESGRWLPTAAFLDMIKTGSIV